MIGSKENNKRLKHNTAIYIYFTEYNITVLTIVKSVTCIK